ncbi:hypothetical protein E2C01_066078 [Portunus trituberculatus]|uniref:Uncharacterized protein n=1 Tax=Portunus trituberculatus TaxID=210409 RepID=A0A5B7HQ09_PORTR|nr:hypothetical protein [Portunus trituberculatus]
MECPSLTDLRHRYLYRCRGKDSGVYYISKVLGPECLAQGHDVLNFLGEAGLLPNLCQNAILFKDLKKHWMSRTFAELTAVHGLDNHVNFVTHMHGVSLDPVLTDFPANVGK